MEISIFKDEVKRALEEATGVQIEQGTLEIPPDPAMGDIAFPCFHLSKSLKKAPAQIAAEIEGKIRFDKSIIQGTKVIGPYINFFIDRKKLASTVIPLIRKEGDCYGSFPMTSRRILLEGFQPNTHKAFHIGHIRNALLGESLARILKYAGRQVTPVSYMGDTGAHVAKWIWYYLKFSNEPFPDKDFSKWAGEIYAKATSKVEEDPNFEEEIHDIHKRLEDGDPMLNDLWQKTRKLCLDDFFRIFKELDCNIEKEYYESEVDKPGKEMTIELEKRGVFEYSDGAIIANLKDLNLGVMVMLKKNGATLYSTKDLGLAKLKMANHEFDESLYVVASEQEHHFRQIFQILKMIDYPGNDKLTHVSYGVVKLASGKMSSRKGNVVLYEDFRDELLARAREVIDAREEKIPEEDKDKIVNSVAFAAMKYTMLSQDPRKEIVFDLETALDFGGDSGPYLLYTYTRIASILRKHGKEVPEDVDFSRLDSDIEKEILKEIMSFPGICLKAANELKPNHICNYLLSLCQKFNEYYHANKIVQEDKELEDARIALADSVRQTIKNGMRLIGMTPIEKM